MNDDKQQIERNKVRESVTLLARQGIVEIEFEKVDGTVRTIRASLMDCHIPKYDKKTDRIKPQKDDLITVVNIEKQMWCNIKIDNIRKITAIS